MQRLGHALVKGMPKLLAAISVIGTVAMLWVGGHILLVGLDDLGVTVLYDAVHQLEEDVKGVLGAVGGIGAWVATTVASAVLGLTVGAILVTVLHRRGRPNRH